MKDKVNVLFVCGYGLGSSAMAEVLVKKGLAAEGISAEVKHTAVGEMSTWHSWTDIVVISKKLAEGITLPEGKHLIEIVNIMDGVGIAKQVGEIVDQYYPEARK
jgi:PTS system ascorbate-specific IIB component